MMDSQKGGPGRALVEPFLEVKDLQLHYATTRGVVRAVDGVSFTLEQEGETLGIVGESGSGKSSLALALMRVLPRNVAQYTGSVRFQGTELMSLSDEAFRTTVRWKKIALVFQGAMNALNSVLRVGDQIAEPLRLVGTHSKGEVKGRVEELLGLVGLSQDAFSRYPHELSGGMRQRILIAMALVLEPQLVILDEPTSALDVSIQAQIMNLLKRLRREMGLSIVFITHDIALASDLCDRIAVAYAGELVEEGSAEEVLTAPAHPYTRKLLASMPRLSSATAPEFIPGAPPDLITPPTGCRFHSRCAYAFEPCPQASPPPFAVTEGQMARCWLFDEQRRQTPPTETQENA